MNVLWIKYLCQTATFMKTKTVCSALYTQSICSDNGIFEKEFCVILIDGISFGEFNMMPTNSYDFVRYFSHLN